MYVLCKAACVYTDQFDHEQGAAAGPPPPMRDWARPELGEECGERQAAVVVVCVFVSGGGEAELRNIRIIQYIRKELLEMF